jgi:hypothetical protein
MKVYVGTTRSRETIPLIARREDWEALVAAFPPDGGVLTRRNTPRSDIVAALQANDASMVTITLARPAAEDVLRRAAAIPPRKDAP